MLSIIKNNNWKLSIKGDYETVNFNYNYFEQSACIRKYFDSKEQKYYDTDHPKFRWPIIGHGTYNKNNIFYNIIIESCKDDTLNLILGEGFKCIKDPLIELNTAYFYFINHYINLLNYKNPNKKLLFRVSCYYQINYKKDY